MENRKFPLWEKALNLLRFEILEHGHLFADANWRHHRVTSPFNRLYFILAGEGRLEDQGQVIPLQAGFVYLIPLYSTYDYLCDGRMEKFYLHFNLGFPGYDLFTPIQTCLSCPCAPTLAQDLLGKVQSRNPADILGAKILLLQTLLPFLPPQTSQWERQIVLAQKYARLFQYLEHNCVAGLTLPQLAAQMHQSVSTLSKNFKQDTGITLKSYLEKLLIQRAEEKLLVTALSIKEIAYQLGFQDPYYFSRFFKKHVALSPREYRRQNKLPGAAAGNQI